MFDMNPNKDNRWSSDRILVLRVMDDKAPRSSTGTLDTRLFKDENTLHAHMEQDTCLWFLRYAQGNVPPLLRKKFTKFNDLLAYAKSYYNTRNVDIVEVKNAEGS